MVIPVAGRPRLSPLAGGGRQKAIDYGSARRRENRPLAAQESGCPCHLGDRQRSLRPAHLHPGGGIPQVIMGRRLPPGADGHDHLGCSPVGFGLADPFPADGQRRLPGGCTPVALVDHPMGSA
jgi:hypothetical protein